ncbi:MAG TPA: hypothetical protein VGL70_04425 [Candidatus Binatia bacterium]|jgi:hypothetical protein
MARATEIQEEIKETHRHIEDTGSAMVEKLELLEQRVRESVEGVKRNFDLQYQAHRHPLALFGGSLVVGYLLGTWFGDHSKHGEPSYHPRMHRDNGVRDHLKNEIATTVKGMAAGALTGTLWEMVKQVLFRRGSRSQNSQSSNDPRDLGGGRGSRREGHG